MDEFLPTSASIALNPGNEQPISRYNALHSTKIMARPAVLSIDDDVDVLKSIERDLRRRYADRYRVLSANSGQAALSTLDKLMQRGDPVALFVVDHRMPQMDGVEFLTRAVKLFPESKRVLLTAYADTDAAIRAINDVKLNHYLLKPWDPPEEHLFPVLDDLLEDWQASYHPPFEGIRVFGTRWDDPGGSTGRAVYTQKTGCGLPWPCHPVLPARGPVCPQGSPLHCLL